MLEKATTLPLKDRSLLRQANLLGGKWVGPIAARPSP